MQFHITMSDASTTITDWVLSRQQNLTAERKEQIFGAEKYNVLTKLFNASSLMLVAGVVNAIFFAMSSAFVFLALGLFLRTTTNKEIEKYTLPVQAPQQEAESGRLRDDQIHHNTRLLQHALDQTANGEKVTNIFDNVGLAVQPEFVTDAILFFDFSAWKNSIDIPEVIVQRREESGSQEERSEESLPAANNGAAPQNNANAGSAGGRRVSFAIDLVSAGAASEPAANAVYNGGGG